MKKILLITSMIIVLVLCAGCNRGVSEISLDSSQVVKPDITKPSYDLIGSDWFYIIDNATGVVYLGFSGAERAGITVALNADGTPVTVDQIRTEGVEK